jgi:hypothetical protein
MEWNRLRQKGSIDEFLDDVNRLMWITGYQEDVVKDKLRSGLTKDLAKEWSRVHPKPETVDAQIALLREMGHTTEDHERLEARRKEKNRDREPDTSCHRSNRRPDKPRKGKTSDRKDRESSKSIFRRDEAVKGVSQEVLSQRKLVEARVIEGVISEPLEGIFIHWASDLENLLVEDSLCTVHGRLIVRASGTSQNPQWEVNAYMCFP